MKVVNHKLKIYSSVPVIKYHDKYDIELPDSLYSDIDRSASKEFDLTPPDMKIENVTTTASTVTLEGYLYKKRIAVETPQQQALTAGALLEDCNIRISVPLIQTRIPGGRSEELFQYDAYQFYKVDYSGSGFQINLDLNMFTSQEGRYYFYIYYSNSIVSGNRLVRGANDGVKSALERKHFFVNGYHICFRFDERKTLYVLSEKIGDKGMVSVLIPVYNCENTLRRCLNSLAAQTYPDLEILLLNDGSTDNSLQICREYKSIDDRFHILDLPHAGVAAARNQGLKACHGKYLMFADADDLVSDNYVERLLEVLLESGLNIATCLAKDIDLRAKNSKKVPETYHWEKKKTPRIINIVNYDYRKRWSHRVVWGAIYRSEIIGELRFDETLQTSTDTLFITELLSHEQKIVHTDDQLYVYVMHPNSLCHQVYDRARFSGVVVWERAVGFYGKGMELPRKTAQYNVLDHAMNDLKTLALQGDSDPTLKQELIRRLKNGSKIIKEMIPDSKKRRKALLFIWFPHIYLWFYKKRHGTNNG